jgi:hypothetical protein
MTDQQRLLVAMLNDAGSTEADVERMCLLDRLTLVDLVLQTPARCR